MKSFAIFNLIMALIVAALWAGGYFIRYEAARMWSVAVPILVFLSVFLALRGERKRAKGGK